MNLTSRQRYVRRPDRPVAAVRLALDTDGLVYRKWGGEQRAKAGDWIVDNDGDVYTVDADVFARTYRQKDTARISRPHRSGPDEQRRPAASGPRKAQPTTTRGITSSRTTPMDRTNTR